MSKSQFAYLLKTTSTFDPTNPDSLTEEQQRTLDRHFAYVKALTDERTMILVGRSVEPEPFGIAIFEAESEAEARATMLGDPAITGGIMTGTLHPFRIVLTRPPEDEDDESPKSDGGIH